jgi:hypothetical protein
MLQGEVGERTAFTGWKIGGYERAINYGKRTATVREVGKIESKFNHSSLKLENVAPSQVT